MQLRSWIALLWAMALLVPVVSARSSDMAARGKVEVLAAGCAFAQAMDAQGQPVFMWQHAFKDGAHDLAMARTEGGKLLEIHRVTFHGSREAGCHYTGLALAHGGDWGWHLAWALAEVPENQSALRYARMDGAAWVSSPAKRFGDATAHEPHLQVAGERVELRWLEKTAQGPRGRSAVSGDEGRSWE